MIKTTALALLFAFTTATLDTLDIVDPLKDPASFLPTPPSYLLCDAILETSGNKYPQIVKLCEYLRCRNEGDSGDCAKRLGTDDVIARWRKEHMRRSDGLRYYLFHG